MTCKCFVIYHSNNHLTYTFFYSNYIFRMFMFNVVLCYLSPPPAVHLSFVYIRGLCLITQHNIYFSQWSINRAVSLKLLTYAISCVDKIFSEKKAWTVSWNHKHYDTELHLSPGSQDGGGPETMGPAGEAPHVPAQPGAHCLPSDLYLLNLFIKWRIYLHGARVRI